MPPAVSLLPNAPLSFDAPRPSLFFYAGPIASPVAADTSNPKWIQLCTVGSYVYNGTPVTITPATFDMMVANFRAHPAYRPDGRALFGAADAGSRILAGQYGVIALNFDHPPRTGPRPGHGWFLEVERRDGELWGLCWFDQEAFDGLCSGKWKWTSIEWDTKPDNQGRERGPYLSGVALTNDPFIVGMTPIQMSRSCCPDCQARDFAASLNELTADERAYVQSLSDDDLKRFAAYPWDECIADQKKRGYGEERAKKICGSIKAQNQARAAAMARTGAGVVWFDALPVDSASAILPPTNAAPPQEKDPMGDTERKATELGRRLAARLNALAAIMFARDAMPPPIAAEDEPRLVIESERFFDRATDVMNQMAALQQSLGAKTPEELTKKMTELSSLAAQSVELQSKINALLPEVEAATVAEETAEGEMAKQDVAAVMSRMRASGLFNDQALAAHEKALLLQRLGGDLEFGRYKRDAAGSFMFDAKGQRVPQSPQERRAFRQRTTEAFRREHQIQLAGQAPQTAQPQAFAFANLFAGPGAQYPAGERPQPQSGQPWLGFSAAQGTGQQGPQGGVALPAQPPAGGWSWARVAALPPNATNDDAINRIVDEMIRTELPQGARPSQAQLSTFFSRVPAILAEIEQREGPMPPHVFNSFRRA